MVQQRPVHARLRPDCCSLLVLLLALHHALDSSGGVHAQAVHTHLSPKEVEQQLKRCYNGDQRWEGLHSGTFEGFLKGEAARLHLQRVYWSTKRVPTAGGAAGDGPLSLFTATTLTRLQSLSAQCRAWTGVLAVAVYVPVATAGQSGALEVAVLMVQQLFDRMEAEVRACVLRVLLVAERVAAGGDAVDDVVMDRLLPINSLRNTALLATSTPLVAMLDVDLLPSAHLSQLLTQPSSELEELARLCQQQPAVVVMAAFETARDGELLQGQELALDLVERADKARLLSEVQRGRLIPFAQVAYSRGHNATNFAQWLAIPAPATLAASGYKATYQVNYEPWFIVARSKLLLYDARFRGYGWNKAAQVAHHNMSGFAFWVHPTLFLVHRPHPKSDAQSVYVAAAQRDGDLRRRRKPRGAREMESAGHGAAVSDSRAAVPMAKRFHRRVAALRHLAVRDMRTGQYKPVPGNGVLPCRRALAWWGEQG